MSLSRLSNMCSHIQNCSKARLGLTSVPNSKMSLRLMLALQNEGLVSNVVIAGPRPPIQFTSTSLQQVSNPDLLDPSHPDTAIITQDNVASRRIWFGLKYWKEQPVINKMLVESRPRKRVNAGFRELERIIRGSEANYIKGLREPGELLFLSTDKGIMEAREAAEKKLGGLVLCRIKA